MRKCLEPGCDRTEERCETIKYVGYDYCCTHKFRKEIPKDRRQLCIFCLVDATSKENKDDNHAE